MSENKKRIRAKVTLISSGLLTLIFMGVNYLFIPTGIWMILEIAFLVLFLVLGIFVETRNNMEGVENFDEYILMTAGGTFGVIAVMLIALTLFGGAMFNASEYTKLISETEVNFNEAVESFNVEHVQTLDKNAAQSLGDRTFGTIGADNISQFCVSDEYTQQVYNGRLVRVTPAEYNGLGPALGAKGTPGYIIVDVVTGESRFVKTEPMVYVESAMFGKKLSRHLKNSDPFLRWGSDFRFEIDEEGNPFYITSIYSYKALVHMEHPTSIAVISPITGEINIYKNEEAPVWVDNVYSATDVIQNYRWKGQYINGWWNSLFAKKGILSTTDDYAYLMQGDSLYMYTGVTSMSNDESNVGFIYTNLHNQETVFISAVGAEEYSAKDAAEGAVQEKGYTSVFPVMVNVGGRPTYFLSLKDKTGLIKAYAFVDYADYTKVKVTESEKGVKKALENYVNLLQGQTVLSGEETAQKEIEISSITGYAVNGTTFFYIEDVTGQRYMADISISNSLPFLKVGDKVVIAYSEGDVSVITEIK